MRSRLNRSAFTTVELMLVLVIGGIVAAGIANLLRRQQRFFTNAASLVEERVSLRDATGILPGELRALSPVGGDVLAFSDSALDVRTTIGTAIACDTLAGGSGIALAPSRGASTRLSSFSTSAQASDEAFVYDAGAPDRSSDDAWLALEISSVSPSSAVCVGSPFVDAADVGAQPLQLRFATRLSPTVKPGAFVRVLRRVRYRFYRAGTGDWYLGYAEWDGTGFGVVQPVSGPFASYSRRAGSGLALRYFDEFGVELLSAADAARIARVTIVARGLARGTLSGASVALVDSQSIGVLVRNR